jgi:DNA-binding transcriptional MerR regulator
VEALVEYVGLCQQGDATLRTRKEILMEQRGLLARRITEMRETLEKLDFKIANYENLVFEYEKKLV